jgi:DNA-binding NarL/FixJ family response regulator
MVSKMPEAACEFHWAASYEQGLRKLSELRWDLCLLDYQLGAHTGMQVVTEARARGVDCPFLLLTGAGSRTIDLQAMRAGVKGYMEKGRLSALELERAMRYAIGGGGAHPGAAKDALSEVPPEVAGLVTAGFTSKQPFVVICLLVDKASAARNHLGARQLNPIHSGLESMIRARISSSEALFRTAESALLVISSAQDPREARQFLSLLLSEPLAISNADRGRSVSLPALMRRHVFNSEAYIGPAALLADLNSFLGGDSV